MKSNPVRRALTSLTAALVLVPASLPYAQAEIVDTPAVLAAVSREAQVDRLQATL